MSSRMTPDVGSGRIMISDGGPHPPELWAQVAADQVTQMGPDFDPVNEPAMLRLKAALIEALTKPFGDCAEAERTALGTQVDRLTAEFDPGPYVAHALSAVQDTTRGSLWEEHFRDHAVLDGIKQLLEIHLSTVQHIERGWHAARNPNDATAAAFLAQYHPRLVEKGP